MYNHFKVQKAIHQVNPQPPIVTQEKINSKQSDTQMKQETQDTEDSSVKDKNAAHNRCMSSGIGSGASAKAKSAIQTALKAIAGIKKASNQKEGVRQVEAKPSKPAATKDIEKIKQDYKGYIAGLRKEQKEQTKEEEKKPTSEVDDKKHPEIISTPCISGKTGSLEFIIVGKQIGQGAYAAVRLAFHKNLGKKVALKVYNKKKLVEPQRQKSVYREIKLLEKMNHLNIVKLYDAFDTDRHVILVMEYVRGHSLHGYLKAQPNRRFEEWEAKKLFRQVVNGIEYCHSKSIAHRDIKLENLLMDENNNVKIIDFGFSTCIPNTKKIKIFCGTPSYMSPEIVMRKEYAGPPADVWALGVLLYALLCGCFPFKGRNDKELYRRISNCQPLFPEYLSAEAKSLLQKIFQLDPDKRPTARQLLADDWFTANPNAEANIFHNLGQDTPKPGSRPGINLEAYMAYYSDQCYMPRADNPELLARGVKLVTNNVEACGTVNNNINIINNITQINCPLNGSLTYSNQSFTSKGGSNCSLINKSSNISNAGLENSKNLGSVDNDLVSSIIKLGYSMDEIMQQIQNENSHIHKLYNKLLDEKKQLNMAIAPQVVPSITSSFDMLKSKSGMSNFYFY